MSISIRKEREKYDPDKNKSWKKTFINELYQNSQSVISSLLPHYIVDVVKNSDEQIGYKFSKPFKIKSKQGDMILGMEIIGNTLYISFYAEGEYTEYDPNREANKFQHMIFSIEQNLSSSMKSFDYYTLTLTEQIRKYNSTISEYI